MKLLLSLLLVITFFDMATGQALIDEAEKDSISINNNSSAKYPSSLYLPIFTWKYHIADRLDIQYSGHTEKPLFTATKPYLADDLANFIEGIDPEGKRSIFNKNYLLLDQNFDAVGEHSIFNIFYKHPTHFFQVNTDEFKLAVNPILHFEFGTEKDSDGLNYFNSRGVEVFGNIADRVSFYSNIIETQANPPAFVDEWIAEHNQVFPGQGRTKPFKETGVDVMAATGYISVKPFKQLDIQFGQDKNHIGNGYRSLFLSDFSKDYLFLKLNTQVWKINYQNLFTQLIDYRKQNIADGYVPRKFATFHHLTVAPIPNLQIGLFEGVVFGETDSTAKREFELYYLNPLIFYRPVEFHLGSSDNAIIGFDWKYNFLRRFSFYGQVMIDDLIWGEFLEGSGWWGNKYGFQAGLKYIDVLGIEHLDIQAEFNMVRPYAYSHTYTSINYSHYSQPLAHPLGANFQELVGIIYYQPLPKLFVRAQGIMAEYGADGIDDNWGSDIFLPNTTRERDFDNEIAQGTKVQLQHIDFTISYLFRYNIFFDIRTIIRNTDSDAAVFNTSSAYIGAGIRMNIPHRNFSF